MAGRILTRPVTLDLGKCATDNRNIRQVIAIELALGISLPVKMDDWPPSLAGSWNEAESVEAFSACASVGDLARAFLAYRLAFLDEVLA
ncbi:MAG: hypothetical protein AAF376_05110 [Pseudomonadota bacterium]